MNLRLEDGHKTGTPWHTVKPRARRLHIDTWMVYSDDLAVFGPTLDDALHLWRRSALLEQIEKRA